jgi:cytochrome c peroxidase
MNFFSFFTINRARLMAGIGVFVRVIVFASITLAQGGGVIITPTQLDADVAIAPNFFFELEGPPQSLKEVPVWWELEQMLDNPYAMHLDGDPNLAEELSGYPAYVTGAPTASATNIQRRRSYLPAGCDYNPATAVPACNDALLAPLLVHPLNYNPMNGEEMRTLNPGYRGGPFNIPTELVQCSGDPNNAEDPEFCHVETTADSLAGTVISPADDPNRWVWVNETVQISPGADRVGETAIDFNSPVRPDLNINPGNYPSTFGDDPMCMVTTELVPPEGSVICGGDPGEPGYLGFGVVGSTNALRRGQYSMPAVAGVASPTTPINLATQKLIDPAGCGDRNSTPGGAGSCAPAANGVGIVNRLLKPTVRDNPSAIPNYLRNSVANLAANGQDTLAPSNENDYYAGNNLAQKRASRDEAAVLGKALFWDMQVGSDGVQSCGTCHFSAAADDRTKNQVNPNHLGPDGFGSTFEVANPNEELVPTDFPFSVGGDTAYTDDVASSMGVHFGKFGDIPPIGTWVVNASGVRAVPIDLRSSNPIDNIDPIAGFAGTANPDGSANEFRRVEPRNTPTLISADFNFDNFWDGRARHDFNGGSVFGAADPQAHVFVANGTQLVATRQLIRNVSLASLATGPGLSEFEMSDLGRNWSKIGKKLLQSGVTPLANQLVDPTDSVLGIYSNQGGSGCTAANIAAADRSGSWVGNSPATAAGKPGLCISYAGLIRRAYYPALWNNTSRHLNGAAAACTSVVNGVLTPPNCDPFDGYTLTIANNPASATNTNQFTQMEGNFSLFWGLSIHAWAALLIPDNSPFDQFMDANPDSFKSLGEANEPGLVWDMLSCSQTGGQQPCFTEVGPFKRDPGLPLNITGDAAPEAFSVGTRQPGDPDPLLGFDIFYGFNLSGKNPEFRTTRCGECHAGGTTTDHTVEISNQLSFGDFVAEFVTPGVEILIEPLGRNRVVTGFELEGELMGPAQDGVERRIANQNEPQQLEGITVHFPDGQSFFDNGMYNIGVTPCNANYDGSLIGVCDDIARGGNDAFGFPLSLATLMMKNLGGVTFEPGSPMDTFDPDGDPECAPECVTGGLFEETAQDQEINPGFEDEPANPLLPPYLAPFASNITVGDESEQDEAGGGGGGMVNTVQQVALLEGFVDTMGPFNPAATIGETFSMSEPHPMGTWMGGTFDPTQSPCYTDPTALGCANRVGRAGSFKAPSIRNVELTGPYFHNGGKLTIGQVVDFYMRGGDFAETNTVHRDFNIMNLLEDGQALGGLSPAEQDERILALIDFVLTLTDERVRWEQAPFDHPEVFVPLDGRAPENSFGRPGFLAGTTGDCLGFAGAGPCFRQIPAVGAAGNPYGPDLIPGTADDGTPPTDGFLGVNTIRPNQPGFNCDPGVGAISQYCTHVVGGP